MFLSETSDNRVYIVASFVKYRKRDVVVVGKNYLVANIVAVWSVLL